MHRSRVARSLLVVLSVTGLLAPAAYAQADSAAMPVTDRILGVFDRQSGAPLADVEVRDLATGLHARTTQTGTVSLARLGIRGATLLQLRKLGYRSVMFWVEVAQDSTPITMTLVPLAVQLPEVVVKGRGPADTVRKLELNGFYERRRYGFAPSYSYITAADLERWHVERLSDVYGHIPRDIGKCATYLDGIVVHRGEGVVTPEEVAALEVYNIAEAPVEYMGTLNAPCVALIWTK